MDNFFFLYCQVIMPTLTEKRQEKIENIRK
jgi:hypothetical protein